MKYKFISLLIFLFLNGMGYSQICFDIIDINQKVIYINDTASFEINYDLFMVKNNYKIRILKGNATLIDDRKILATDTGVINILVYDPQTLKELYRDKLLCVDLDGEIELNAISNFDYQACRNYVSVRGFKKTKPSNGLVQLLILSNQNPDEYELTITNAVALKRTNRLILLKVEPHVKHIQVEASKDGMFFLQKEFLIKL